MLPPANGATYEQFQANGWTDEQLVAHGYMAPVTSAEAVATDDRLRLLIERVERLEEERKGISDDIRDTYAEAKAVGYDAKIMRQIVKLRKMKPDDRAEMEAILETYKAALGLG
jgi:uncharacterized protein (UPF0335 family)